MIFFEGGGVDGVIFSLVTDAFELEMTDLVYSFYLFFLISSKPPHDVEYFVLLYFDP